MAKKSAGKKKSSSPDYPLWARGIVEASRDGAASKLSPGLYVVATPIGNRGDISLRALATLVHVDAIACEDTRTSGALLASYGIKKPLLAYHDHNAERARPGILKKIAGGKAVALVSDAGMPLIADPGNKLVRACRDEGYAVTVIPGASAALTALAGSGLPTDKFSFIGFLPPKQTGRRAMLEKIRLIPVTAIFYEAPQRLADTLADMAEAFGPSRRASVARELTKLYEETVSGPLGDLATHYREHKPQGEITIVVAAAEEKAMAPTADLDALLEDALRTLSLRDAVEAVTSATGARRSEVYTRALLLKSSGGKSA